MEERIFFWCPARVTPTLSRSLWEQNQVRPHGELGRLVLRLSRILLGVELRDDVQVGEASLQEARLVPLHLYGPEPLGHRAAGRQGRGDPLVQQGLGRTGGQTETR